MNAAREAVREWVAALPEAATSEQVDENFWYVRIPGSSRSWIPVEIEVSERTTKVTSQVIITPDENHGDVYAFLLRHNHRASGVAFSLDGKEGVISLVARVANDELNTDRLDLLVGQIVEETETTFRTILQMGFAGRLRRRG